MLIFVFLGNKGSCSQKMITQGRGFEIILREDMANGHSTISNRITYPAKDHGICKSSLLKSDCAKDKFY